MARERISLRQFEIDGQFGYEAVADLVHRYRQCDWRSDAYGCTPVELVRLARAHAKVCDGKPQPRPPRPEPPAGYNAFVSSLWAEEIGRALQTRLVTGQPFVTGLPKL